MKGLLCLASACVGLAFAALPPGVRALPTVPAPLQSNPVPTVQPPPGLPDPANDAVDTVNGVTQGAQETVRGALPQQGGGQQPDAPTGSAGGGGAPGSSGGGSSGSSGDGSPGSSGDGSPGSRGDGRATSTGRTGAGRSRTRSGARGRGAARPGRGKGADRGEARGERARSATEVGDRNAAGRSGSGPKDTESQNPVARVINRIERAIPTPIWVLIGLLALLAVALGIRSRITGVRARRLERHRQELLGDVGLLQRALLPEVPPTLNGIDVSVAYRPADGPGAGGDFYDVFDLGDQRAAVIVGDVCGHGRSALPVTALMRYTLRAYLRAGFEPRVALQIAGRTLNGDDASKLTTVVIAVYDANAGTLTYACAGHQPPIVLGPAAYEPVTLLSSPPLGDFLITGQRQTTVPLPGGSSACFFTDGLVEAQVEGDMLGRDRLSHLLAGLGPGEGAAQLLDRLAGQAEHAPDDMAACLLQAQPNAVRSDGVRIEELELDGDELAGDRVLGFLSACGVNESTAFGAIRTARATAAESGGAVLRVYGVAGESTVEVVPSRAETMPLPALSSSDGAVVSLKRPAREDLRAAAVSAV